MTLTEIILSALLLLPRFSLDTESAEERVVRLHQVAEAVNQATLRATCSGPYAKPDCRRAWLGSRTELAAAMMATAWHESAFAEAIGRGDCASLPKGMQCDNGKARGYWQVWNVACPAARKVQHGSPEELQESAWCAARLLSHAYRFCADVPEPVEPWARAFGRFAGRTCRWTGGSRRIPVMRRVLANFARPTPLPEIRIAAE